MGLDTYAGARPPTDEDWKDSEDRFGLNDEDIAAFERAEAELEEEDGCVFGGNYFRGKIFNDLVRDIAGVTLYREWIPPETVAFMADAFEDCDIEQVLREQEDSGSHHEHSPATITSLACFFRLCADRHLGLVGSW